MRSAKIPCSRCKGTGVVQIEGVYLETLQVLAAQAVELNGADLARLAGVEATTMNNRLVQLEAWGLASRRTKGRQCLWRWVSPRQMEMTSDGR